MMTITIQWFSKDKDLRPVWDDRYVSRLVGTAAECMSKINAMREVHNLAEFTRIEIVYVEDLPVVPAT